MLVLFMLVAFVSTMLGLCLQANRRFRGEATLPMQWSLSRERPLAHSVNWSAPRPIALALIPGLGIATLAALVALMENSTPRPGQEGVALPAFLFIGCVFITVQVFHLWMVKKTLDSRGH